MQLQKLWYIDTVSQGSVYPWQFLHKELWEISEQPEPKMSKLTSWMNELKNEWRQQIKA